MKEPVAAKFLRSMISCASSARYSSEACFAARRSKAAVEVGQLLVGVAGLAQLVAAGERQGFDAVTDRRVGVVAEPRRRLHDVGVGVVDDAVGDVRHVIPPDPAFPQ